MKRSMSIVAIGSALGALTVLGGPMQPVFASCDPGRSAVAESHKVGGYLNAQSSVFFEELGAGIEPNEPFVFSGTTYLYMSMIATSGSGVANLGIKKGTSDSSWVGYIYFRDYNGTVYAPSTFDPTQFIQNGYVRLAIVHSGTTWYFKGGLSNGGYTTIWSRDVGIFGDFDSQRTEMWGLTSNRDSQMPGGTGDHTRFDAAYYRSNFGTASWSPTLAAYNTTYYGATASPWELWDKGCST